ncbi:alpha/beta hydrolase [Mycobacteroides salmoniphilum]|uniref:alpha/beta fold hydrolase n=1 Tax=Mycobacteroides salmoniphilum TaxID=404941 RepID=UPI00356981B9
MGNTEQSAFGDVMFARTRDGRVLRYVLAESVPGVTVVFESGLGFTHAAWAAVQPAVAAFASTVVYDRAGYGASTPDPQLRLVDRMADDLSLLLDALVEHKPTGTRIVLVGHSLGALIAQLVCARVPERISGLVLVDGVSLDMQALHGSGYAVSARLLDGAIRIAAGAGVLQRVGGRLADRVASAACAAEFKRYEFTRAAMRTRSREVTGWLATLAASAPSSVALPDIPITVLSGARTPRAGRAAHEEMLAAHQQLAASTPNGRHVHVDAGHTLHLEQPAAVIAAIQQITEQVVRG